jgi:hypothetical protein
MLKKTTSQMTGDAIMQCGDADSDTTTLLIFQCHSQSHEMDLYKFLKYPGAQELLKRARNCTGQYLS